MRTQVSRWASRCRGGVWAAVLLTFTVAGPVGATAGAMLHLGVSNTSNATTTLTGSSAKGLQVTNTRPADATVPNPIGLGVTATNGTPLQLTGSTARPPFITNSSVKVANLNADRVDSLDSTQLQRRVSATCPAGSAIRTVTATGTVTCETDDVNGGDAQTLDGSDSSAFLRSGMNSTGNTTILSGNASPQLSVAQSSSSGTAVTIDTQNGTPLSLNGATYRPPFITNSSAKVDNLNADQLDGVDSTAFQQLILPSGTTEMGIWGAANNANSWTAVEIEFRSVLAAGVEGRYVRAGDPPSQECPGRGRAARGYLCVYEVSSGLSFKYFEDPVSTLSGVGRFGAIMFMESGPSPAIGGEGDMGRHRSVRTSATRDRGHLRRLRGCRLMTTRWRPDRRSSSSPLPVRRPFQ